MLNKVILIGNMTREPELRYLPSGSGVCEFVIAMNRKFKDKEEVVFVDIVCFGKSAESTARFTKKGSTVAIEGRLSLDQWQDKQTGQQRSKLKVKAEFVKFLDNKQQQQSEPPAGYQPPPHTSTPHDPYGEQDDEQSGYVPF